MGNNRSTYLDTISGVLILYMILGHLFQLYDVTNTILYHIHVRVFFFFMSWFFYKAGMFNRLGSIKQIITRSAKRLLVPFFIFSFLGSIILACILAHDFDTFKDVIIKQQANSIIYRGSCDGNLALWFLLTLFFVKILYAVIKKMGVNDLLIISFSFCFAIICNYFGFKYPLYIANSAIGLCMYSCGSTLPFYIQKLKNINMPVFNGFIFCVFALYISILLFGWCSGDIRSNGGVFPLNIFWLISSLLCCIGVNELFSLYLYKDCYFSKVGEKSMCYLVLHWPIIIVSKEFLSRLGVVNTFLSLTITAILLLFLLPFFCKIMSRESFRWLIGE